LCVHGLQGPVWLREAADVAEDRRGILLGNIAGYPSVLRLTSTADGGYLGLLG